MDFPLLQPGILERRYKRFLADVTLPDGQLVVAHCPNTGAMTGCAQPKSRVWLSPSTNPKRKLAWTLELVESDAGLVCVHSALANTVVMEALSEGLPTGLAGFTSLRREVKYGQGSRADFCLDTFQRTDTHFNSKLSCNAGTSMMVEVKSVTLYCGDGLGKFPDSVSARATRHVQELTNVVVGGGRAAMVFCAFHSGVKRIAPAADIDPMYTCALEQAAIVGVEMYGIKVDVSPEYLVATVEIPVLLG